MNRGFRQYFKETYKKSFKYMKKTSNYYKYLVFMIMNFFANFMFLFKPVADMASIRMTKNIRDGKDICISSAFVTAEKPKNFWNYLLISGLKFLIWTGIFVVILFCGGLLALIGYAITTIIGDADSLGLVVVMAVPAIIVLIVFLIIRPYLSVSTAYLTDTYPNESVSKLMYSSFESLKRGGKKTLFVNDLVHTLVFLLKLLPAVILLILTLVFELTNFLMLTVVLIVLVALRVGPRIALSHNLVVVKLFDDIVLDDKTLNQKFISIDADKFGTTDAPLEKRLLNVFEGVNNLNLEAKLFSSVPNVKIEEKPLEPLPGSEEVAPVEEVQKEIILEELNFEEFENFEIVEDETVELEENVEVSTNEELEEVAEVLTNNGETEEIVEEEIEEVLVETEETEEVTETLEEVTEALVEEETEELAEELEETNKESAEEEIAGE